MKYFGTKTRTMYVVLEREDTESYEGEESSVKKESVKEEPSVKEELSVKQEKKAIKTKLKTKRPPSDSYKSPQVTRARDQSPSPNLTRTNSKPDIYLPEFDDLLNLKPVDDTDGEKKIEKEATSSMTLRTRK